VSSDNRDRDRGEWSESVVAIRRCAAVVKGGRRFSFNALVVVGNGRGQVAWGYGKANEVPPAVEKGVKDAHKQMIRVNLRGGRSPTRSSAASARRASSCSRPARAPASSPAAPSGRSVQATGITDILTKSYGSTNKLNLVKAAIDGLKQLRTKDEVARLRGVPL
jgi:small subunit ribosomal protein S5